MPGITIGPADAADADAIALVHVRSWRAAGGRRKTGGAADGGRAMVGA
jgi:hypothetical protein